MLIAVNLNAGDGPVTDEGVEIVRHLLPTAGAFIISVASDSFAATSQRAPVRELLTTRGQNGISRAPTGETQLAIDEVISVKSEVVLKQRRAVIQITSWIPREMIAWELVVTIKRQGDGSCPPYSISSIANTVAPGSPKCGSSFCLRVRGRRSQKRSATSAMLTAQLVRIAGLAIIGQSHNADLGTLTEPAAQLRLRLRRMPR